MGTEEQPAAAGASGPGPAPAAAAPAGLPSQGARAPEGAPAAPRGRAARPTNCPVCNKVFRHRRWYYRDGGFYCNKRCWRTGREKERAAPAAAGSPG